LNGNIHETDGQEIKDIDGWSKFCLRGVAHRGHCIVERETLFVTEGKKTY